MQADEFTRRAKLNVAVQQQIDSKPFRKHFFFLLSQHLPLPHPAPPFLFLSKADLLPEAASRSLCVCSMCVCSICVCSMCVICDMYKLPMVSFVLYVPIIPNPYGAQVKSTHLRLLQKKLCVCVQFSGKLRYIASRRQLHNATHSHTHTQVTEV